MLGGRLFEVVPPLSQHDEKGGCSMTLSEMIALLALLVAAATLIVEIINMVFNIMWKVSHDETHHDNKKSE